MRPHGIRYFGLQIYLPQKVLLGLIIRHSFFMWNQVFRRLPWFCFCVVAFACRSLSMVPGAEKRGKEDSVSSRWKPPHPTHEYLLWYSTNKIHILHLTIVAHYITMAIWGTRLLLFRILPQNVQLQEGCILILSDFPSSYPACFLVLLYTGRQSSYKSFQRSLRLIVVFKWFEALRLPLASMLMSSLFPANATSSSNGSD